MESQLRQRKTLPHTPPPWVRNADMFFITIKGSPRGYNQFANNAVARSILDSGEFYHSLGKWHCRLLLIMPDCLHLLASFPGDVDMKVFVTEWKSYLSKRLKVRWQRDFLDRRIRNNEGLD